ncbi:MAG: UDP-N-acetylmuramate dehydrogenase [Candidatus Latescibacteria bacterium]|nr:UDP-N-acetylmuramate dehydrogenase [Candidatus Latescibacterota bacterium]NIM21070.1 UDP-N-acetylmuramate dehydrogenase [Candidatus Latescibacterota bacterium]NIO01720.1 UDP-N-acetylmuramate dehydrogenase [Candidatus Latescibacterota bacterium]NIO77274.1 UDP-N-acetylmuramate dehydrogenase [Candidatus Latescibacterota bacterium]NIT01751.1 UDP-N-acetylmuramate dehydrogenase [Candidatus Latescibacterota bacterium]
MKAGEIERFKRDAEKISREGIKQDEPMSLHTTIAVGGPAKFFAVPRSSREVVELVKLARGRDLDFIVIGKGSNLLVRDGGYRGMVIKIGHNLSRIKLNKQTIFAEAGASFSLLARKSLSHGRSGFEFALGIPGTVGGAVRMNAGAYGSEVSNVLVRLRVIDENSKVWVIKAREIEFGYRRIGLPHNAIVLSATFFCPPGEVNKEILAKSTQRKRTQPVSSKSFGCTFVNPPGAHAGRLIDACGLKGTRSGGAMISKKHANFILNVGENTKASDVEALIDLAKREVRKKFGVSLRPEVIIIGH